jgi:oligopeptide/dipeptide ABC transporter ATP-binding protein
LGVVAGFAERVLVMYAGRIVESAAVRELFARPSHPYTLGLLQCAPRIDGEIAARLRSIPGHPPQHARRAIGCAFQPRCALAIERCVRETPPLDPVDEAACAAHRSACCRSSELAHREVAHGTIA